VRYILLGMPAPPLGGCWIYERPLVIEPVYSKSDIDALNAEAECKRLAQSGSGGEVQQQEVTRFVTFSPLPMISMGCDGHFCSGSSV